MKEKTWESILFTEEGFHNLYVTTKKFGEDVNKNHRIRHEFEAFAAFVDKGCDALLADHPELVRMLK